MASKKKLFRYFVLSSLIACSFVMVLMLSLGYAKCFFDLSANKALTGAQKSFSQDFSVMESYVDSKESLLLVDLEALFKKD